MKKLKFYIDFDGTITKKDVIDAILDKFAGHARGEVEKIENKWQAGEIGSRECLSKQLSYVKTTPAKLKKLLQDIEIDPSFVTFVATARELSIPLVIVSDGLDFVIQTTLKKAFQKRPLLLKKLPVYSNKLRWTKDGIKIGFRDRVACKHGCANCKERIVNKHTKTSDRAVMIGDGFSDRFGAMASEYIFAKNKLLAFCKKEKLNHKSFEHFSEITKWLTACHFERPQGVEKSKLRSLDCASLRLG